MLANLKVNRLILLRHQLTPLFLSAFWGVPVLLSGCAHHTVQPITTLKTLQVQQCRSKHGGSDYHYCMNCLHFTHLHKGAFH